MSDRLNRPRVWLDLRNGDCNAIGTPRRKLGLPNSDLLHHRGLKEGPSTMLHPLRFSSAARWRSAISPRVRRFASIRTCEYRESVACETCPAMLMITFVAGARMAYSRLVLQVPDLHLCETPIIASIGGTLVGSRLIWRRSKN